MFGLMKEATAGASASDLRRVKNNALGSSSARPGRDTVDASTTALVKCSAFAFGGMSGKVLAGVERAFKLEPNQRPVLRRLIVDSFTDVPVLKTVIAQYKQTQNPRHDEAHRLVTRLCQIARECDQYDARVIQKLIKIAKALGLSQGEILSVMQKARLTA